jgi:hypothetical protein
MSEATHRLDQLRDAVDDILVVEQLYRAAQSIWEFATTNPNIYEHRNFEIFAAELVKRGKLLRELRQDMLIAWLEGSPIEIVELGRERPQV